MTLMLSCNLIVLVGSGESHQGVLSALQSAGYKLVCFKDGAELFTKWKSLQDQIRAVIFCTEVLGPSGLALHQVVQKSFGSNIPYFILTPDSRREAVALALKAGVSDVLNIQVNAHAIVKRVDFVIANWSALKHPVRKTSSQYQLPLSKRLFDIAFSTLALLLLSPLLVLVIIAVRLESKGPVFYYSLRVGTGYKVFRFYKFRSMYQNADQRLKELKHLNQYNSAQAAEQVEEVPSLCVDCRHAADPRHPLLYADQKIWCEQQYRSTRKSANTSAFIKIKDDPRITRVGKFLRNTSIDELPQLVNVLLGDMSIVGNRPLPLYEAEQLTTDKYAQRFIAPAGITGLWQVEKRGSKGEMSEEERLELDNRYAREHSLSYDLMLILRTIPALLQKENV